MNHSLMEMEDTYNLIKERLSSIPENYKSSGISEVETGQVIDPQQVLTQTWKYPPALLWRLHTDTKKYYTPKPISVRIYRDEDFFFAENENLAVCGTGITPEEALSDFCLHIIHFFDYYKKLDKNELTGDALRLKELYKDLLIEE